MKQERAVRTRQALIHAAAEAFERNGYVQAKLSDISARAGVSAGALHFHFTSKAAVAATVMEAAADGLRRAAHNAQRPDMNALQRLTATTYALAELIRTDVVARAGFRLSCESPHRTSLDLLGEWEGCVQQLLAEADRERLLADGVRRQDMVTAIVGATTGFEALARRQPDWLLPVTLRRFWRLLLPRLTTPETLATLLRAETESATGAGGRGKGGRRGADGAAAHPPALSVAR
ncbi:TetR/AcrR family transcriptional regulator [Streptomyces sp. 15-116A]|uniref:ScbR family autoregulator-binding transcription factor n=1 Tax=Streptomyces sp. 15-116A TaxID=2259035 RepID=UPI0021B26884|nr:ScbR family autoregulator-binding transcription factor [Streptomyces sp. 15-116A]MCT7352794.1 TetR/AcrR family transcriptional regulator [Streptomyces sp. 15-116A]